VSSKPEAPGAGADQSSTRPSAVAFFSAGRWVAPIQLAAGVSLLCPNDLASRSAATQAMKT